MFKASVEFREHSITPLQRYIRNIRYRQIRQTQNGAAVAEWLSSCLAEQEVRGSIPRLATWISEIGYLPFPNHDMADRLLMRRNRLNNKPTTKRHRNILFTVISRYRIPLFLSNLWHMDDYLCAILRLWITAVTTVPQRQHTDKKTVLKLCQVNNNIVKTCIYVICRSCSL